MATKVVNIGAAAWISLLSISVWGSELADANRLFVLEKYEDAIAMYEKVASGENREEAAEALFGVARAYQMLGRWRLARDGFQKLLEQHSGSELSTSSKIQVGQCEIKLGNLREALALFREVEEQYAGEDPAIEATYNIANLNAGFFGNDVTNARAAIKGYQCVLDSGEGERYAVQSHFGLGQCYMLLRDYRQAIESFGRVMEKGPDTVWAVYARDQIGNALRAFGDARLPKPFGDSYELPLDLYQSLWNYSQLNRRLAWQSAAIRPALRIYAVGFFTEKPKAGSEAGRVFYSKPTIRYKNYVFSSDRGTVDRAHRSVECMGTVKFTNNVLPPTLTVTSGGLTLDLSKDKAVFTRNVRFERKTDPGPTQQLLVEELHFMLASGIVEVPAAKSP